MHVSGFIFVSFGPTKHNFHNSHKTKKKTQFFLKDIFTEDFFNNDFTFRSSVATEMLQAFNKKKG